MDFDKFFAEKEPKPGAEKAENADWIRMQERLFPADGSFDNNELQSALQQHKTDPVATRTIALTIASKLTESLKHISKLEEELTHSKRKYTRLEVEFNGKEKDMETYRNEIRALHNSKTQLQHHTHELTRKIHQQQSERDIYLHQMRIASGSSSLNATANHSLNPSASHSSGSSPVLISSQNTSPELHRGPEFRASLKRDSQRNLGYSATLPDSSPVRSRINSYNADNERPMEKISEGSSNSEQNENQTEIQEQLSGMKEHASQLELENLELHQHLTKTTANATTLQNEILSLRKQLENEQEFRSKVNAQISSLENQVHQLDQMIKHTRELKSQSKDEYEKHISVYAMKVEVLQEMLENVQDERDRFSKKIHDLSTTNETKTIEFARAMGQIQMEREYLTAQLERHTQSSKQPDSQSSDYAPSRASEIQSSDLRNSSMGFHHDAALSGNKKTPELRSHASESGLHDAVPKPPKAPMSDTVRKKCFFESDAWRISFEKLKTMEIRSQYLHKRLEAIIIKEFKEDAKSFFMLQTIQDLHEKINRAFERTRTYKLSRKDIHTLRELITEKIISRQPLDDVLMENLPSTHTLLRFIHVLQSIDDEEEKALKRLERIENGTVSYTTPSSSTPIPCATPKPTPPVSELKQRYTPRSPKLTPRSRSKSCSACTKCGNATQGEHTCAGDDVTNSVSKSLSPPLQHTFRKSVEKPRKPARPSQEDLLQVNTMEDKASALFQEGKIVESFVLHEEALQLRSEANIPGFEDSLDAFTHFCNAQSTILQEKNDIMGAHRLLCAAERWTRDSKYSSSTIQSRRSTTLNNLGCFYKLRGRFSKALEHLFDALSIETRIGKRESLISLHLNVCAVASKMAKHQLALQHGLAARGLLESEIENLQAPSPTSELPLIPNAQKSQLRKQKTIIPQSSIELVVITLFNISAEYEHLRNPADAKIYLKKTKEIAIAFLGPDHPLTIQLTGVDPQSSGK